MKKMIKLCLLTLLGLILLVFLVAGYFAATFNPNDYKDDIIKLVKEKKDRTLHIEGDIALTFWPKIGADLGKISLSEHKSETEFASVSNVKVALAVMPLLQKQLVVDTIYIDGAKANVIKNKDGKFNFDDLISKDEEESEQFKFDVDGVNVTDSEVRYTDEATGAKYTISKFNMKSGHIALAEPVDLATDFNVTANQPELTATVNLKGNFLVDPETKHFKVKGLDSQIIGDMLGGKNMQINTSGNVDAKPEAMEFLVDDLKFSAHGDFSGAKQGLELSAPAITIQKDEVSGKQITAMITQDKAGDTLKVNMVLADMKGSPKALQSSGISGDIAMVQGKRTVAGKFSSPFSGNLDNLIFDLPKLAGNLDIKDPALPGGGMKGAFNLGARTEIKNEIAKSNFNVNIEGVTKLAGNVDIAGFSTGSVKFNLNADKLDLNKLLPKSTAPATNKQGPSKPADLSALKGRTIDGKLSVGQILYDQFHVNGLNVVIKADGDKLNLTGLDVKVDDSHIKGSVGISHFAKPLYTFDLDIDQVNLDRYASTSAPKAETKQEANKALDLSALKALNADGAIRIGKLKYGNTNASNINIQLKADGEKLNVNPLSAKVDDSQINANLGIRQFSQPIFSFNINIDKLDADRYITKTEQSSPKSSADTPIDLSALKKLNASGEAKIGWLKLANVKSENVHLGLKADQGLVTLAPFAANLYQGSMDGSLKVDARSTPSIAFKQNMKGISIGPLMVDAINNDMLEGKGTLNVDVTTSGNSVNALKKALAGNASLNLADGAVKGFDIAGSIRELKSKVNVLKSKEGNADKSKKTDFSELTATFAIKNGVAHNEDLAMKAPILRLAKGDSKGDVDIANEKINYTAKPTIVKSLKGQGGAEVDELAGIAIPIKISGTFANPKYGMDFSAVMTGLAQSKLLDKVGGEKGAAVGKILGSDNKADALKDLLGNQKKEASPAPAENQAAPTSEPQEAPKSAEEQAKEKAEKKLKKLLKF